MKTKEEIKDMLDFIQSKSEKELDFDEEAILSAYQNTEQHSLAMKVLSVFGGFLGSCFFLVFLFLAGIWNSEAGMFILGAICIGAAIVINKNYGKAAFDPFSVSPFILGFFLVGTGFGVMNLDNVNFIYIVFIILAAISLVLTESYLLSFLSIIIINFCLLGLILQEGRAELLHLYVLLLTIGLTTLFLKESQIIANKGFLYKIYEPLRISIIFSFLSSLLFLGTREMMFVSEKFIWISSIAPIFSIIFLITILFPVFNIHSPQNKAIICSLVILALLPTVLSPAISGSLLIILLCFRSNYKTGFALGFLAAIYFVAQYYYDLNLNLLTKSIILFLSGFLFILLYLFTQKQLKQNEKI